MGTKSIISIITAMVASLLGSTQVLAQFRLACPTSSETSNLEQVVQSLFGSRASLADWKDIKTHVAANGITKFYQLIGFPEGQTGLLKRNGSRIHEGSRHYYIQRFDSGPPASWTVHDKVGSAYLGSWYGLSMSVIVRVSRTSAAFQLACPMFSETDDLAAKARNLFGVKASLADWRNIKAFISRYGASMFYEGIGFKEGESAMVMNGGKRISEGNRHYYVQRFDNGPPDSWTVHDKAGTLYLGSWYGISMRIIASLGR
jgi:hypothetical protein